MPTTHGAQQVSEWIKSLASAISAEFSPATPINIVGIRTRGEILAQRLEAQLKSMGHTRIGRGVLDITLYRDDLGEIGPRPVVRPTVITVPLDDTPLILVDDVLFTGRSVRAALDALADLGRPSVIRLAVLVDRGGRQLPIQPDYVALKRPDVPLTHRVTVKFTETDQSDEVLIQPKP